MKSLFHAHHPDERVSFSLHANIPQMANARWTMSSTARSYNREIATKEHPRNKRSDIKGKFVIAE